MQSNKKIHTTKEIIRVNGKLKEIITVFDTKGAVLSKITSPLMIEFHLRDLFQLVVGSSLLAFPISVSEEVWMLTESLPTYKILVFSGFTVTFISLFIFYNFYRGNISNNLFEFIKRVFLTYTLTLAVSSFLLFMVDKAPWGVDNILAIKRTLFVAFPASFSATIADSLK